MAGCDRGPLLQQLVRLRQVRRWLLSRSLFTFLSCIMQQEPLQVYTYHWPFMSAIETGSQQPVLTVAKQIST